MRPLLRSLVLALGAALAAGSSSARAEGLVGLQTGDDLRGWEAVGRLNIGKRGFCTGTLIAPDLVLTAAHCLFEKDSGHRVRPETIEFAAGFRNGRADAYRAVSRAVIHPDYLYTGAEDLDRIATDMALLQLAQPVLVPSIQPMATGARPHLGDPVDVVSYAHDRAEVPSLERGCKVLDQATSIFVLSCDVDFGSSGAPILRTTAEGPIVVSLVSAKADAEGKNVALGMALDEALPGMIEDLRAGDRPAVSGVRVLSGGNAGTSGAKFVKPAAP